MGLSGGRTTSFKKQEDTFTRAGNGTTVDVSTNPFTKFTLSVRKTGEVTSWVVVLEGSVDGTNFTTIAKHTDVTGDKTAIYAGSNLTPCTHFRTRCDSLTLDSGTNVIATVLGS